MDEAHLKLNSHKTATQDSREDLGVCAPLPLRQKKDQEFEDPFLQC